MLFFFRNGEFSFHFTEFTVDSFLFTLARERADENDGKHTEEEAWHHLINHARESSHDPEDDRDGTDEDTGKCTLARHLRPIERQENRWTKG